MSSSGYKETESGEASTSATATASATATTSATATATPKKIEEMTVVELRAMIKEKEDEKKKASNEIEKLKAKIETFETSIKEYEAYILIKGGGAKSTLTLTATFGEKVKEISIEKGASATLADLKRSVSGKFGIDEKKVIIKMQLSDGVADFSTNGGKTKLSNLSIFDGSAVMVLLK